MQQLITTPNKIKCINLDWLSVYCLEPKGVVMNAAYFKALGWTVEEREYGTPQYREKFTLMNGKHPFLEIERNPYSLKQNGGIFEPESCHIRLANRTLYQPQPVQQLTNFIVKYGYEYKGISRVDVCCDLTIFDNAMKPQDLANKYMKDKIWKVHQSKIDAHSSDGDDSWRIPIHLGAHGKETKTGRTWNSLKWGSPKSAISTKLYNKTLELETNTGKFYIKDADLELLNQRIIRLQEEYDISLKFYGHNFTNRQDRFLLLPLKIELENGKFTWLYPLIYLFENNMGILKLELPIFDSCIEPLLENDYDRFLKKIINKYLKINKFMV